jgi:hypothetical protein
MAVTGPSPSGNCVSQPRTKPAVPLALWLSVLMLVISLAVYSAHLKSSGKGDKLTPSLKKPPPPAGEAFPTPHDIEIENLA